MDTYRQEWKHECLVREIARWMWLSEYSNSRDKRIEHIGKLNKYFSVFEKISGAERRRELEHEAKKYIRDKINEKTKDN